MLNDIIFGDTNIVSSESNGLYLPLTKEIFLNIDWWKNSNRISNKKKIDGIFSTINHEYGHHISNMYLNTSYAFDSWQGDDGYVPLNTTGDVFSPTHWNKEFTETFYETLNYNNKELSPYKSNRINSISSKISLFDLFWKANGLKKVKWVDENYEFGLPVSHFENSQGELFIPRFKGVHSEEFNEYRYSLDEIVTRQLGQLMNVYKIPDNESLIGSMVHDPDKNTNSAETFLLDANSSIQIGTSFTNQRHLGLAGLKKVNGKWIVTNDEGFYKDYIFGKNKDIDGKLISRAKRIYDSFTTSMGYGKLISNIYAKNKTFATVDPTTLNISAKYSDDNLDEKSFKISGFAPKNVSGIYRGDLKNINEENLHRFGSIKDRIGLWSFNRKSKLLSQDVDYSISKGAITKKDWIPYITNDYIDASYDYNGGFMWWIDDNSNNKLDPGELKPTTKIIGTTNSVELKRDMLNQWIPISTFRQSWGEGLKFPRITVSEDGLGIELTKY
ncbi:MYPU_1760 family metalloprotease [Mycoplasma marinum]|uniref:Uncharacterized protein n=1 Tax=Mycoplasma marinum TaxID=1937190 RepID=A0A4V2NI38_9MOLU|nr:hypothetical protein [Mycoplasma marinum]TCG10828.1 hypothetical protein C4B24_03810 [Mycoplasma marinum]